MILLIIIGVLLLAALGIVISQRLRPNTARSWLIGLAVSLLAWGAIFYLRLYLPTETALVNWTPAAFFQTDLSLQLNYNSWPYAFALLTVAAAVLLTDSTRSFRPNSPYNWAGALAVTGLDLVAIMAGDPLTMVFAWVLVDLAKFLYLLVFLPSSRDENLVGFVGMRILSIFALIIATAVGWQVKPNFTLASIPSNATLFFLVAVALRLGVLPLNPPYLKLADLRRGVGLLLRIAPLSSALVLLSYIPAGGLPSHTGWFAILRTLVVFAAVYASFMWLTRANEDQAHPYWIVALSAFAIYSSLNGQPVASRVWGLALILSGSLLLLFDPPIRRIRFLPLLGLLGLVGLPYTPAAAGWIGLTQLPITAGSVALVVSHALLVLGYLRYAFEASTTITGLEKFARITFPLGLILLLQTILVIGLLGWPGSFTHGSLWPPIVSLLLVGLGIFASLKLGVTAPFTDLEHRLPYFRFVRTILLVLQQFFEFKWLLAVVRFLAAQLERVDAIFTQILEGEGGMLWDLVFLVIIAILFLTRYQLP